MADPYNNFNFGVNTDFGAGSPATSSGGGGSAASYGQAGNMLGGLIGGDTGNAISATAGGASMGFAVGGPIGAAIGGGLGLTSSLLGKGGGGQKTEQGKTLPPGYELQLMAGIDENLSSINSTVEKLTQIEQAYNDKINILQSNFDKTVASPETLKQLSEVNSRIALNLGLSAEQMSANGFLSATEAQDLQSLRDLESSTFEDPTLNNEISAQKARLEQDLARAGVGPAGRQQAIQKFEQDAREAKFKRSQELKVSQAGLIGNRIQLGSNLQGANLGRTLQQQGALQGTLGFNQQGIMGQQQLNQAQASNSLAFAQGQAGLRSERNQQFDTLGNFKFSKQGKQFSDPNALGAAITQKEAELAKINRKSGLRGGLVGAAETGESRYQKAAAELAQLKESARLRSGGGY